MLKVGIIDKRPGKGGEVLYCDDLEKAISTVEALELSSRLEKNWASEFLSKLYFSWDNKTESLETLIGSEYCCSEVEIYIAEGVY